MTDIVRTKRKIFLRYSIYGKNGAISTLQLHIWINSHIFQNITIFMK